MPWVDGTSTPRTASELEVDIRDYVDTADAGIVDYADALMLAVASTQAANYTLVLGDSGSVVEGTKATAQTVTVPPFASVAFAIGTLIEVLQYGAGQITLTPGAGVTLQTPSSLTTRAQYSTVFLRNRATDEWVVSGDLT